MHVYITILLLKLHYKEVSKEQIATHTALTVNKLYSLLINILTFKPHLVCRTILCRPNEAFLSVF